MNLVKKYETRQIAMRASKDIVRIRRTRKTLALDAIRISSNTNELLFDVNQSSNFDAISSQQETLRDLIILIKQSQVLHESKVITS